MVTMGWWRMEKRTFSGAGPTSGSASITTAMTCPGVGRVPPAGRATGGAGVTVGRTAEEAIFSEREQAHNNARAKTAGASRRARLMKEEKVCNVPSSNNGRIIAFPKPLSTGGLFGGQVTGGRGWVTGHGADAMGSRLKGWCGRGVSLRQTIAAHAFRQTCIAGGAEWPGIRGGLHASPRRNEGVVCVVASRPEWPPGHGIAPLPLDGARAARHPDITG